VKVGRIYRIKTTLTKPSKEKIVLYIGDDLFLLFNTDARARPAQMEVAPGECPEITHKCYLDCGRVTTFSQREIDARAKCDHIDSDFAVRVVEEIEERATSMVNAHRNLVAGNLRKAFPDAFDDED
jgi:hypothetical protein